MKVTVDIYGHQYKLTGHSSMDYIRRVAALVDENMHKLAKGYPRLDVPKLAVLAALHMAEDVFRLRQDSDLLKEEQSLRKTLVGELEKAQSQSESLRMEMQRREEQARLQLEALLHERDEKEQALLAEAQERLNAVQAAVKEETSDWSAAAQTQFRVWRDCGSRSETS